ncbi:hypothetical protein B0H13DRAFT_2537959 [Mycena leptocephala]|nr:hypothetical protein B0H13DRAFT_2537959 [Mycena leptocephala]
MRVPFRALFLLKLINCNVDLPLRPRSSFPCPKLDDVWHPRPSNAPRLVLVSASPPTRLHCDPIYACSPTSLRFVPLSLHFVLAPRFCVYVCAHSYSFPLPSSMLSLHPLALSSSYTFSVSSNAPPHLRPFASFPSNPPHLPSLALTTFPRVPSLFLSPNFLPLFPRICIRSRLPRSSSHPSIYIVLLCSLLPPISVLSQ